MPRPKKKQIKLEKESVLALMQEIYNECIEQRNTAIRIQNKMLGFMHEAEDLQLLGPVIKEQQKIIDSVIEKKIQLTKIQSSLIQKQFSGEDINIGKLSSSDRETLNTLLTKDKDDKSNEYKI
jgi:hypothetical protein